MPAVVLRGPSDDRHIRPIIDTGLRDFAASGDEDRDVRDLTRAIMRSLEATIRAHPDQWFIFRRLWADPAPAQAAGRALAEGG
jgi:lauroyl/myristoyl acyltransferase